jgi:putative phosphoribosyl transferase
MRPYKNRTDAGRQLARALHAYAGRPDVIVLALPRGGVPIGYEVASALDAPLDVFIVRNLGVPWQPELAMGAIASGGVRVLDERVIRSVGASNADIERVAAEEQAELARREHQYRGGRPRASVAGKIVLLVDDGLATGSTMRAAIAALRKEGPLRIVVAVPVGAPESCGAMAAIADDVMCAKMPPGFSAVGSWYEDFSQTTDEEVRELLDDAATMSNPHESERTVLIPAGPIRLEGTLTLPRTPTGVVVFAHGSGSSRFSSRNRRVAAVIREASFATLLFDLLSANEADVDEVTLHHRFDIAKLADRVVAAIDWLAGALQHETAALPVGLFGASTGGAAALVAATMRPARVSAVVSRGGRPDLAGDALPRVAAPTLLIVGGNDDLVLSLNQRAMTQMRTEVRLETIPGATHLFEEPGALDRVALLARDWFSAHQPRQAR